jgi:hypothetical protein
MRLSGDVFGGKVSIGPIPWLRVERTRLIAGPDGRAMGEFRNHQWLIEGNFLTSLHFDEEATLHFESDEGGAISKCEGAYGAIRIADGAFYANDQAIALFDDAEGLWLCRRDGRRWPRIVVSAGKHGNRP